MKLNTTTTPRQETIVALPTENLDAGNVKAFRDAIAPILDSNTTVVIDMSNLSFVDSSGLGSLLSCLRTMHSRNGELRLYGMSKPVKALFELVRMHRIFPIYNSREEALEAA